jgi:hypothetical protein
MASETGYFYCTSQTEFAAVKVTQVISQRDGRIFSTFKIDVWDLESNKTVYWQSGSATITSDDSFRGPFKDAEQVLVELDIKAPTFPDYKPRESFLIRDEAIYALDCHTLY